MDEKVLANKDNFIRPFSKWNRHWFARKIIDYLNAKGLAESEIESHAQAIISKSKTIVRTKRDFDLIGPGIQLSRRLKRVNLSRRIEIIYSTIATHPEFADPDYSDKHNYSDFLDFIVRRRYRSVVRMDYYVNYNKPKHSGKGRYVRYPERCSPTSDYQVRVDARVYWNDSTPGGLQILLKPDPASIHLTVNPKDAVISLFEKPDTNPCRGNLLECSRALTIVYMDSLLEAQNPEQLLRFIIESILGLDFFSIQDVDDHRGFVDFGDYNEYGLFDVKDAPIDDLVVGDHVYISNHSLYRVFRPRGVWRGEFSLVYSRGNQAIRTRKGYKFGGHGMEGTIFRFYTNFLKELKTHLHRSYRIAKIHLQYKQDHNNSLPTDVVPVPEEHPLTINGIQNVYRVYRYATSFRYRDYEAKPTRNDPRPKKHEHNFLIIESLYEDRFIIDKNKDMGELVGKGTTTDPITFVRSSAYAGTPNDYDPIEWEIEYLDIPTSTQKTYPLFKRVKDKVAINQINRNDLLESPFYKIDYTSEGIETGKPRIDFSDFYQHFLRNNGGI